MTKTQELTKQVMELHMKQTKEMRALEAEREKALEEEKDDEMAIEIKGIYDSYIKAGFTEKQAWELLTIEMKNAFKGGN